MKKFYSLIVVSLVMFTAILPASRRKKCSVLISDNSLPCDITFQFTKKSETNSLFRGIFQFYKFLFFFKNQYGKFPDSYIKNLCDIHNHFILPQQNYLKHQLLQGEYSLMDYKVIYLILCSSVIKKEDINPEFFHDLISLVDDPANEKFIREQFIYMKEVNEEVMVSRYHACKKNMMIDIT